MTKAVGGPLGRHDHVYKEVSNPVTDFGNGIDWSTFRKFDLPPLGQWKAGALAADHILSR